MTMQARNATFIDREDKEVLEELLMRGGESVLGYGEPAPRTKKFIAAGLVSLDFVVVDGVQCWKASLTRNGRRAAEE